MTDATKKFVRNPHRGVSLHTGEIIGVWLDDNEEVSWTGYNLDGEFVVTGYTINRKFNWSKNENLSDD